MRRLALLLGLFFLALAPPAAAVEPVRESFVDEGSFVDKSVCGFRVLVEFRDEVDVTTYFDSAGNPIRLAIHVNGRAAITGLRTGKTAEDNYNLTVFVDLVEGTETVVGLVFSIQPTPGGGSTLVLDAGRVVFSATGELIFEGGPHEFLHGETEELCAYLADP